MICRFLYATGRAGRLLACLATLAGLASGCAVQGPLPMNDGASGRLAPLLKVAASEAAPNHLGAGEPAPTRTVTWVMVADPKRLCSRLMPRRTLWAIDACADFRDPNHCVIYAKPPRSEADRQSMFQLGHELLHCFVGQFHP